MVLLTCLLDLHQIPGGKKPPESLQKVRQDSNNEQRLGLFNGPFKSGTTDRKSVRKTKDQSLKPQYPNMSEEGDAWMMLGCCVNQERRKGGFKYTGRGGGHDQAQQRQVKVIRAEGTYRVNTNTMKTPTQHLFTQL